MAIIDKINSLISAANTKTGESDTTLTDAVQTLVDGYGQGSDPVINSLTVTENGTYTAPSGVDGYSPVTVNVQGGGGGTAAAQQKDVNFIDYDGTILYSYTATEFAALSAMPANPNHSGDIKWGGQTIALTSQGWNYTLAKAQAYVAKYGKLWVGQMYVPTDGKTYVCIHLEEGRTSPKLGICPNGTVDVDWGDGTTHDTLTGTSLTVAKWTPTHNYSAAGDYVIKLNVTNGTAQLYGGGSSNNYAYLLRYASGSDVRNQGYHNSVQSIFVGNAITINKYAFYSCYSLNSITIPNGTSIGEQAFYSCYSLNSITIPNGVTSIGSSAFYLCYSLNAVTIPDSVTSIGSSAFYNCYSLNAVTIPDGVTSIAQNAFYNGCSLNAITIPDSVTSIGVSIFRGCSSLNAITIPDSVTSIDTSMFRSCSSLNAVTIPDSVTSIGNYAFESCYFLSSITFESATPPSVGNSNAWSNIPTDCIIYVPAASLDTYKAATNYPSSTTYTYTGY